MEDINTAIRMVGHLLEHHSTTGSYARTKTGHHTTATDEDASCFCFVGAVWAVTRKMGGNWKILANECSSHLNWTGLQEPKQWDSATDSQRLAWARKLQKVGI